MVMNRRVILAALTCVGLVTGGVGLTVSAHTAPSPPGTYVLYDFKVVHPYVDVRNLDRPVDEKAEVRLRVRYSGEPTFAMVPCEIELHGRNGRTVGRYAFENRGVTPPGESRIAVGPIDVSARPVSASGTCEPAH